MSGISTYLHNSGMTPTVMMKIAENVPHSLSGDMYLMGRFIIVTEDEHGVSAHIRPDLMKVTALRVAAFYSCCDLVQSMGSASVSGETITFHDDNAYMLFCSMFMSRMYKSTESYRSQESMMSVVEFLGWNPLFRESVYPTPGRSDKFTTGVSSFLGPILFNNSPYLEHYTEPVSRVSFPKVADIWDDELLNRFDHEYACHVDEYDVYVDIIGSSSPTAIGKAVNKVLTFHLPDPRKSVITVVDQVASRQNWPTLKHAAPEVEKISPVNWRNVQ